MKLWFVKMFGIVGSYLLVCKRFNHRWVKPEGFDTGIKLYNCITKDKQPLIVRNKHLVTWYTCGPTVYDSCHIGHASCYLKLDIIQRIMRDYFNLNLVTAMNITDVDDKIIARSNALKIPAHELTQKYEKEFWADLNSIHVHKPNYILRVTENVEAIKRFIQKLVHKKMAYQAEDNSLYFDVQAYGAYGKLQNPSDNSLDSEKFKKSNMDFALWKASKPNEISWESVWGTGRPGWHIECSALATLAFGSEIDVHAGGIDLRFPHHENEETQSCAFHDKAQWVNYWVHPGHLHLKNCEKMSKSLKNTISIKSMLEQTSAQALRLSCVMSHYRSNVEFNEEFMATAYNLLKNYVNFIDSCHSYINGYTGGDINDELLNKLVIDSANNIHDALTDDFDTPRVVGVLNQVISVVNSMLHLPKEEETSSKSVCVIAALNLVIRTLTMFGISVNKQASSAISDEHFVEVMTILNNFRQDVRQLGLVQKNQDVLTLCDNVRDNLKKCGISVKDHGKVSSWSC